MYLPKTEGMAIWTNKPNSYAWEQFLLDINKNNCFFAFSTVSL